MGARQLQSQRAHLHVQRPYQIEPNAGPQATGEDHIDWDMWLGHKWGLAPKIPWNPEHFFRFRKYWPYNGGVATDLLYHKLAPLLIAVAGANGEYPWRVNASGGLYIEKDGRDIPDTFLMTADYPSEWSHLPREHADERRGIARPHLRQARHDGTRRRAVAESERRVRRGIQSEERRQGGSAHYPSSSAAISKATSST